MQLKQIYQIYEELEKVDIIKNRKIICRNVKKYRLEFYNEYRKEFGGRRGSENPYSTENISEYLNISDGHYRRLEGEKDKHKYISIDNLIKLSYIFDKKIDDFLVE